MLNMAVDVGFGRVKGLSGAGVKVDFPSVIGDFHPVKFISGMEGDWLSHLAVEYGSKRRFIGDAALKQTIPQATVDKERTISEEGMFLLVGALAAMSVKGFELLNLVVGLPVIHYEGLKQKYLNAVKTMHTVDMLSLAGDVTTRKYLNVMDVKVLPQPFGTLFNALLNEKGELTNKQLAAGKVGVIDIGYNTLDLARADSLEFINPRSTSFSGLGMFTAFQALSAELYRSLGVEIPPERIEPVIKQGAVKLAGKVVYIEHLKISAFKEAASQILSRVKSVWPDRWELDRIIISGGGAIVLGDTLLAELGEQAFIIDNPVFANVAGYLKFAQRIWQS